MHLTARTEYAALAAVELARRAGEAAPVGLRSISEAQGVPARFLVHILLELKRAGIVASVRGAAGGYRLARPADAITLQEIRAAVAGGDDASSPVGAKRTSRSREALVLQEAWQAAARAEARVLGAITLAELAARSRGTTDPMYYI